MIYDAAMILKAIESPAYRFTPCVPWSERQTATPIQDIQAACQHDAAFQGKIRIFVNHATLEDLNLNRNQSDIGGRSNKFDCENWQLMIRAEVPLDFAVLVSESPNGDSTKPVPKTCLMSI